MSTQNTSTFSQEEADLYDRQIRLWGVEAQQRMRNASVLIITLRGISNEVCKNIVLAGVGKVTVLDGAKVEEEDLGTGFFLRDEDIGKNRALAARDRIQALNPRVEVVASEDISALSSDNFVQSFDLVCLTESDRDSIIRLNDTCRRLGKKFYASGSFGFSGYVFADLISHDFILERDVLEKGSTEPKKVPSKHTQDFVPFSEALKHTWAGLSAKKQKRLSPLLAGTLILWEYQSLHSGSLPQDASAKSELSRIASVVLPKAGLSSSLVDENFLEFLAQTAAADFMPSCAVIGGLLGQDILNTIGGKELPLVNLFVFDGSGGAGAGDIHALGITHTKLSKSY